METNLNNTTFQSKRPYVGVVTPTTITKQPLVDTSKLNKNSSVGTINSPTLSYAQQTDTMEKSSEKKPLFKISFPSNTPKEVKIQSIATFGTIGAGAIALLSLIFGRKK